jgi:PAS domain S-box-containing protein
VLDSGVPQFGSDGAFTGYRGSCVDVTDLKRAEVETAAVKQQLGLTQERLLGRPADTAERRQTEDPLRRKELELNEAQRLAGVGSWQWDKATNSVVWSRELYRILGLDPGSRALTFSDRPELFAPECREQVARAVDTAIRFGMPYELDVRMLHSDGSWRWVTARGEEVRDAHGAVVGLRGTLQDITERKQREEALSLFRSLIDGSNDGLQIIDPETHRLIDVNDKACRDLGYSRQELLALSVPDIDPTVDARVLDEILDRCSTSGFAMFESVHRRKDGSWFPVEVSTKCVMLDRRYCVRVSRDITERKAAQEALRESEERFRLAAEAGRMFAYTWDAATDVITRSGESKRILGVDSSALVTREQVVAQIHPEDRDRVRAKLNALTPAQPELLVNYRFYRPDGSMIWVERTSRAYFDDSGGLIRIVGMVSDITERKRAEEVLSNVSRRLIEAQEVERLRIARDLHDDIGQRLTLLSVMLEQLKRPVDSSSELANAIDALQRQTSDIATDVQALSHELHSSKLELLGLVPAMRGYCAELSAYQEIDINFEHHEVPPRVANDVSLSLFRVLQEALGNAVKHSAAQQFDVTLRGTSDGIHLSVRDSGVGFDVDSAWRGPGLGLTSMKERLKLVGGELSIASHLARGTTIVARVPLGSNSDGTFPGYEANT